MSHFRIAWGIALLTLSSPALGQPRVKSELLASGLQRPVFVTSPPKEVVLSCTCLSSIRTIRIIDRQTGDIAPDDFLDLGNLQTTSEQGLLGMAFHPNTPQMGSFTSTRRRRVPPTGYRK